MSFELCYDLSRTQHEVGATGGRRGGSPAALWCRVSRTGEGWLGGGETLSHVSPPATLPRDPKGRNKFRHPAVGVFFFAVSTLSGADIPIGFDRAPLLPAAPARHAKVSDPCASSCAPRQLQGFRQRTASAASGRSAAAAINRNA